MCREVSCSCLAEVMISCRLTLLFPPCCQSNTATLSVSVQSTDSEIKLLILTLVACQSGRQVATCHPCFVADEHPRPLMKRRSGQPSQTTAMVSPTPVRRWPLHL